MDPESPAAAVQRDHAANLDDPRLQRHNFLALLGDYVLFGIAFGFLNPTNLPADFVARLGAGAVVVALAGTMWRVCWTLPQLVFGQIVNRARRKKHYATIPGIPARTWFLPVAVLMVLAGPGQPPLLMLLLLSGYAVLAFGDGLSSVAWMDVLGSSLTPNYRSWLFGLAQSTVGVIVALMVAPLVRVILDAGEAPVGLDGFFHLDAGVMAGAIHGPGGLAFPRNYALLLAIASVILVLSLLSYVRVKECPSPPPKDSPTLRQLMPFLVRVVRQDPNFRYYLGLRFIYELSLLALPQYIVFATRRLGQDSGVAISDQIALTTLAATLSSVVYGRITQRLGSRYVILVATGAAVLGPLLLISTNSLGVLGLHLMWISVGVLNVSFVPGFLNWVVEYAPDGYRPIYGGLANTFSIAALLAPLAGGLIVEWGSYEALFVVAAALGLVAITLALRLPEPRRVRQTALTAEPSTPAG